MNTPGEHYKYPGRSVPGRRIMAGTRAKAPQRCKQPMGTGGHCQYAAVRRQRSDCPWFRPSSTRGHVWRSVGRRRRSALHHVVKKALRSILALHPRDCSSDCRGHWAIAHPVYSLMPAKLCWQHRCQNMEANIPRCDSHSRVAVVSAGPRWARIGAVMSNPLLSRSSTP
jgi:hypothetical protein